MLDVVLYAGQPCALSELKRPSPRRQSTGYLYNRDHKYILDFVGCLKLPGLRCFKRLEALMIRVHEQGVREIWILLPLYSYHIVVFHAISNIFAFYKHPSNKKIYKKSGTGLHSRRAFCGTEPLAAYMVRALQVGLCCASTEEPMRTQFTMVLTRSQSLCHTSPHCTRGPTRQMI